MFIERILIGVHGAAAVLAFAAISVWPRAGQAALLVPLAGADLPDVIAWAHREDAALLELDTTSGRVIARLADDRNPFSALGAGVLPLAARARDCQTRRPT